MHLPLVFQELVGHHPALRSALQAGIIASAAVAGYVTFMPFTKLDPSHTLVAEATQPQWAGHIEAPNVELLAAVAPPTSASYVLPEPAAPETASKKPALAVASVIPKPGSKAVLPPHRPQMNEEIVRQQAAPAATAQALPVSLPTADAKPASRNLFSPVADRLGSTGSLMKPFHAVGDAFQSLIKFF